MRAFSVRSLLATATAVGALAAPTASLGATIDVNSNTDVVADDGHCTLREALKAANANTASGAMPNECRAGAGSDTIELPADHYTRTLGGSGEDAGATGDLDVLEDVTIHGAGSASTIIDAAHLDRVFDVAPGIALEIEGVTIRGGTAPAGPLGTPGGPGGSGDDGGGIRNKGTLTLVGCIVTDNIAGAGGAGGSATGAAGTQASQAGGSGLGGRGGAGGRGGGIFSTGVLTVTSSRVTLNGAGQGGASGAGTGGAGFNAPGDGANGGDGSSLAAGVGGDGGGLFSSGGGEVTVTNSEISGNTAGRGGAGGSGTGGRGANNSTGSPGNTGGAGGPGFGGAGGGGGEGGGMSIAGPLILGSTTISGNSSGRGGDAGVGHGGDGGNGNPGNGHGGAGGNGSGAIAGTGGRGGGVLQLSSLTAVNVTVTGNKSGGGAAGGGGIGGGGGGTSGDGVGNTGGAGGFGAGGTGGRGGDGAGIWGEAPSLMHVTVTANVTGVGAAGGTGAGGGGGGGSTNGMPGAAGGASEGTAGSAGAGGGIVTHNDAKVTSSILAANKPANCVGTFTDGGFNLDFPDSACPGDAADPQVAALADNGGPTPTQAIPATSPALDRVPIGAACAATDQRGVTRPQHTACDSGAFELELAPPPPPPPGGGDTVAPVFSLASLSNKVFAVDPNGPAEVSVAAKRKKTKRGTTFRFTLSEAGRVVFTIERRTVGRKVGKKCRKRTRKNRKRRHCTLYRRAGRFAANGAAGPNTHKFSGRIGRKSLKPGRYRARLVAADSAGNKSKPVLLAFTVVPRR